MINLASSSLNFQQINLLSLSIDKFACVERAQLMRRALSCRPNIKYQYSALDSGNGIVERSPRERAQRERALNATQEWIQSANGRYEVIAHLDEIGSRHGKNWFLVNDASVSSSSIKAAVCLVLSLFSNSFPRCARIACWRCCRCPQTALLSRICRPMSAHAIYSWSCSARCIIRISIPCSIWASCATARITMPASWRPSTRVAVSRISSLRWVRCSLCFPVELPCWIFSLSLAGPVERAVGA